MTTTVTNRRTGHHFEVKDGETVLDAALRQGRVLPYSCRTGTCGTCKASVVEGSVDYGAYAPQTLTDTERAAGRALLCQAKPMSDIVIDAQEIAAAESIRIKTLPCRVTALDRLSHDVMGLQLRLPQGQELNYIAGQYIDILLRDGRRRSFSLAAVPKPGVDLEIHVRHVPGGRFTSQVFDSLKERDLLRFQGPFGTFFLRDDSDRPVVLMAGGTGFAPIKAIVEQALENGAERPMHLFWGVRARRDLYMPELIEQWQRLDGDRILVTVVLSAPDPTDDWSGETGWVHHSVLRRFPDLSAAEVYASGPPPMIEAAKPAFRAAGLDDGRFYFDSFEFSPDSINSPS